MMLNIGKLLGLEEKQESRAPKWFCDDIKKGVDEKDIKEKIRLELVREVEHFDYNRQIWTDDYTKKVANLYFSMFEQLYMESA